MNTIHTTQQEELPYQVREQLASAYSDFNNRYDFDLHLTLRPRSPSLTRVAFSALIGRTFAHVEKTAVTPALFKKRKSYPKMRIWRAVYIEKEDIDIHAHIFIKSPHTQTHIREYQGINLQQCLSDEWMKRNRIPLPKINRFCFFSLLNCSLADQYPVKELVQYGNTDNYDDRSSFLPNNWESL